MKGSISIMTLCFLFGTLVAQEPFKVPELTDAVKHSMMVFQTNGMILNTINYAKSMGKTVEEVAIFTGDQFKTGWNKENGFVGFVNGTIRNWICFIPNSTVEILEQSNNMIKYKTGVVFPNLKKDSPQFNVSYSEYLTFYRIVYERVGEYLGAEYSQSVVEDGIIVTIKK